MPESEALLVKFIVNRQVLGRVCVDLFVRYLRIYSIIGLAFASRCRQSAPLITR